MGVSISAFLATSAGTAATAAAVTYGVSQLAKTPSVKPGTDPAVERAAAEARATQATNSKLAERNRARKASSLLAVDTTTSNVPTLGGKTTLGQ